jgi:integrase
MSTGSLAERARRRWNGAGLSTIGLHECRHTAATWLDAAGEPQGRVGADGARYGRDRLALSSRLQLELGFIPPAIPPGRKLPS